ncbi:MAG: VanZ family protein [Atopobiaceae bacterium]|nr:VanZ family protein [Atopobiaceae bacterium]
MRLVAVITLLVFAFCGATALLGARWGARHRRGAKVLRRVLGAVLFAAYVYGVLSQTILGRSQSASHMAQLELFWSYRASLALMEDGLAITSASLLAEIILNVLMFVPLGALLPFALPELFCSRTFMHDVVRVAIVSSACSMAIELAQWRFRLGLFEFDDILNNTAGALIGYATYRAVAWIARKVARHHAEPILLP